MENVSVSPHSSSGPSPKARASSSRSLPFRQGSFDSLKLTPEVGRHNQAASFPSPFHARGKAFCASDTISEAMPHSAPAINRHAEPPFDLRKCASLSPAPLAKLRMKKKAEQNKRVAEARACGKENLRAYAASCSFKQLSGGQQAAWWCSSSRSLDLSGLSEEFSGEVSREYALLSEGDGEFARLPAVPLRL
jgi:hypothetical protein